MCTLEEYSTISLLLLDQLFTKLFSQLKIFYLIWFFINDDRVIQLDTVVFRVFREEYAILSGIIRDERTHLEQEIRY